MTVTHWSKPENGLYLATYINDSQTKYSPLARQVCTCFENTHSSYQSKEIISIICKSTVIQLFYLQSCRGTSVLEARYTPEGLEVSKILGSSNIWP